MKNFLENLWVCVFITGVVAMIAVAIRNDLRHHSELGILREALDHTCPPCPCQLEPEAELDLPTPRFPRGVVR